MADPPAGDEPDTDVDPIEALKALLKVKPPDTRSRKPKPDDEGPAN